MSTPDLENFSQEDFIKEVRAFMKQNKITARKWAALTKTSLATMQRYEAGKNKMSISAVANFQEAMRTFDASR